MNAAQTKIAIASALKLRQETVLSLMKSGFTLREARSQTSRIAYKHIAKKLKVDVVWGNGGAQLDRRDILNRTKTDYIHIQPREYNMRSDIHFVNSKGLNVAPLPTAQQRKDKRDLVLDIISKTIELSKL